MVNLIKNKHEQWRNRCAAKQAVLLRNVLRIVNIIELTDFHVLFVCQSVLFSISLEAKVKTWGNFFFVICCSICPQNTSLILVNETMESNSMRLNPHIQYYSTVYVVSMGAALFLKTIRGLVFVKVSHPPPFSSETSLFGHALST